MKDELIRDCLVVRIRDLALSERLQLEPDLTLDKAKQLIRQRESVKTQEGFLQKPSTKEEGSLDAVRKPIPRRKLPAVPPTPMPPKPLPHNCRGCGRGAHPRHLCPAKDATRFKCNRRGHYSLQCLSNTIAVISTEQPLTIYQDIYRVYARLFASYVPIRSCYYLATRKKYCRVFSRDPVSLSALTDGDR